MILCPTEPCQWNIFNEFHLLFHQRSWFLVVIILPFFPFCYCHIRLQHRSRSPTKATNQLGLQFFCGCCICMYVYLCVCFMLLKKNSLAFIWASYRSNDYSIRKYFKKNLFSEYEKYRKNGFVWWDLSFSVPLSLCFSLISLFLFWMETDYLFRCLCTWKSHTEC